MTSETALQSLVLFRSIVLNVIDLRQDSESNSKISAHCVVNVLCGESLVWLMSNFSVVII